MRTKIILFLSIIVLALLVAQLTQQTKTFDLERVIKSRPLQHKHIFDFAHILKYPPEQRETHLEYFQKSHGVEMLIVTIPELGGKDITSVAAEMFTKWGIGRGNNGKGILLLLSDKEKLIKVEVGYGAEDIFTDLFCGYIERKQLKPYFENNQVDEGLSATLEEFIGRAEGRITDEQIKKDMEGFLSGGAGIKRDIKIGGVTREGKLSAEEKKHFSAQSTPEATYDLFLETLKRCLGDYDLGIYTEETQVMTKYSPSRSTSFCESVYPSLSQNYQINTQGDYAVVLNPGKNKFGPFFIKKTEKGWQLDILSVRKWVIYTYENNWFLGGINHPYMFAFEGEKYSENIWNYGYCDDYGKFASVKSNYESAISQLEEKIQQNPNDLEATISLAEIFFDLTIQQRAVTLLNRAQELNPQDPRPYRYLGLINRDAFKSTETAINYLKKYNELAPQDANGYRYLAMAYSQAGWKNDAVYFDKAIEYMKKYADLSEGEYKTYGINMVGYFYQSKKDYANAKKWYEKTLTIDPDNSYAKKSLEEIKR